ncbi:uncharacterized protein LOC143039760 [Oratosquilla oratoria]|uniref:uncharacterized protein LOC143039760 n=1 Tax=Oratosquilla oratoria TaxID=337810 RepID=UPI003F774E89
MSSGGEIPGILWREFRAKRKINSCILRRRFLQDCIDEKVLPREAPKQLRKEGVPFSNSAEMFLSEACEDLSNEVENLRASTSQVRLPSFLLRKLDTEKSVQSVRLKKKLELLCEQSDWNEVGNADLIVNLSNRQLSDTEKQALSLGLKFDTGVSNKSFSDFINKNYRWDDSDVEKGFKQGLLTCFHALANLNRCSIPRRFKIALENLGSDEDLVITSADKGGGVVILNRTDYNIKMMDLLNDTSTYEKKPLGNAEREGIRFKKESRRILMRTNRGKKLVGLLEEAPRPPRMRGLPKTHKPGIPMRPITSGY